MWKLLAILVFVSATHGCRVIEQKANGIEQSRTSHPYLVLLETFLTYDKKYMCSGVLISADFVLTTAECVFGAMFVNVHVYAHKLRDVHEPEREIYRGNQIIMKPEFDKLNHFNDIALVKLPSTLKINERPYAIAQLPSARLTVGYEGTLVGWGLLDFKDNNAAATKQSQLMRVVSDENCRQAYPGKWNDEASYEGRVCVQKSSGNNCVSDSGSPFMVVDTVLGLQSFGQQQACDEASTPNGIQEIFFHVDWIKETIKA